MKINVSDFRLIDFDKSNFIKPKRARFKLNDYELDWDFIESNDCVSVFLYHKEKDSYLFVKQFRAPLYYHSGLEDINDGISIELCSGIVDKKLSLEQIALEECIEELGVKPKELLYIGEFYTGFGSGISKQTLYFATICDEDFISLGGGVDKTEAILPVWVQRNKFDEFFQSHKRSPLIDFAHLWFINKYKELV